MKKFIIIFLIGCFPASSVTYVKANDIVFEYDGAGNCIVKRKTIVLAKQQRNDKAAAKEEPEYLNDAELFIFPNPTQGTLKLQIKGEVPEDAYELFLSDLNGKTIEKMSFSGALYSIDMSNYPSGTYILRISQGKKAKEWKIIKE